MFIVIMRTQTKNIKHAIQEEPEHITVTGIALKMTNK